MTYEVTLEKSGRTTKRIIEDVKSEDEAKQKAELMVLMDGEEGFHVSSTKLIG